MGYVKLPSGWPRVIYCGTSSKDGLMQVQDHRSSVANILPMLCVQEGAIDTKVDPHDPLGLWNPCVIQPKECVRRHLHILPHGWMNEFGAQWPRRR